MSFVIVLVCFCTNFLVHIFDALILSTNMISSSILSTIAKLMMNLTLTAFMKPELFTSEVCSCKIEQIPCFSHPSNYFHYSVKLIYGLHTTIEQRQYSFQINEITNSDTIILEVLSTLNKHYPKENNVIILSLLCGMILWKKLLGNDLLFLVPENIHNLSPKSIIEIWENYKTYPLKFDFDLLFRGIGKTSEESQPLILAIKTTTFSISKNLEYISSKEFFNEFYSIENDEIWTYFLNCLLICGEYNLATNLLAYQRNATLSNLFLLQIQFSTGKIFEALTIANSIILTSKKEMNSGIFYPPCLIENLFVKVERTAVVPYVALIQTHLSFLILSKNKNLNNEQRDFILGNIFIMAQLLYKHGNGESLARFICEILETKVSFFKYRVEKEVTF